MTTQSADPMTVEVFMDVICPYCWVGLTRLDKALAGFEHGEQVKVVYRTRRLLKGATPERSDKLIAAKFGSAEQAEARLRELRALAATDGLTYNLDDTFLGDTTDVHRIIKLGADEGRKAETVQRVFQGFYTDGTWIFDHDGLSVLATKAGIDPVKVSDVLNGDSYRAEVEADEDRFRQLAGQSTPFFVVDGKPLPPSQTVESLSDALRAGWAARTPAAA